MDTATELLKSTSPLVREAAAALRLGTFGEGMSADQARWWLQDRGLVTGRDLTEDGEAMRRTLLDADRRARHA